MQQKADIAVDSSPGADLYRQYAPVIFAYLYRQTVSREDAEDILLEVFLAALEHDHFLTLPEKEQQHWLWAVARNKAADHYRSLIRHPNVTLFSVAETTLESEDMTPEQVTLRQEEYDHLHATLQKLSPLQQEVLQLRFGHNLHFAEIASVLEKKEGAVRMLLSRTLKLLRKHYAR